MQSVCVCVFRGYWGPGVTFARMQGSSLFFLPGEVLTEKEEKMEERIGRKKKEFCKPSEVRCCWDDALKTWIEAG